MDKGPEGRSPLSAEELTAIEDEGVLDKMLDQTTNLRRGSSSGLHCVSSDKEREVESQLPS